MQLVGIKYARRNAELAVPVGVNNPLSLGSRIAAVKTIPPTLTTRDKFIQLGKPSDTIAKPKGIEPNA